MFMNVVVVLLSGLIGYVSVSPDKKPSRFMGCGKRNTGGKLGQYWVERGLKNKIIKNLPLRVPLTQLCSMLKC